MIFRTYPGPAQVVMPLMCSGRYSGFRASIQDRAIHMASGPSRLLPRNGGPVAVVVLTAEDVTAEKMPASTGTSNASSATGRLGLPSMMQVSRDLLPEVDR